MISAKNRIAQGRLSEILRVFIELMAAAGEVFVTGRVIKANDSRAGKDEPET